MYTSCCLLQWRALRKFMQLLVSSSQFAAFASVGTCRLPPFWRVVIYATPVQLASKAHSRVSPHALLVLRPRWQRTWLLTLLTPETPPIFAIQFPSNLNSQFEFGVSPSAHSIQAKIQQVNAAAKLTARFVVDAQKLNPSKVQELFEVNLNAEYIRKHGGKAIKLKRTGKYYYLYVTFEHGYPPDFDCVAATSFTTDDFAKLSQAEKPVHK